MRQRSNQTSNQNINCNTRTTAASKSSDLAAVILINMDGMKPTPVQKWKVKALSEKVKNSDYQIPFVIVTESHLKPKHLAAEIHIEEYNLVRADRTTDRIKGRIL